MNGRIVGGEAFAGGRRLVGLVAQAKQEAAALLEPRRHLPYFLGQRNLVVQQFLHGDVVRHAAHMLHRADKLLAAEALEGRGVAGAHAAQHRFVHLKQRFTARVIDHHAAVNPADELVEVLHTAALNFGHQLVEAHHAGVEHKADVGEVILVVGGEKVVFGAVELIVVLDEERFLEALLAQHSSHCAEDAFEARTVNDMIVAPLGPQRRLVDVDNDSCALIQVQSARGHTCKPRGQRGPAIGVVDEPVFLHAEGGFVLDAVGADEACATPGGDGGHVDKSPPVIEERITQEEQFGCGSALAAHALRLLDDPCGCLGVCNLLLTRNMVVADAHVVGRVLEAGHAPVQRLQIAVDNPIVKEIG